MPQVILIKLILVFIVLHRSDAMQSTLWMCQDDSSGNCGLAFSLGINFLLGGLHVLDVDELLRAVRGVVATGLCCAHGALCSPVVAACHHDNMSDNYLLLIIITAGVMPAL
jgi:hypothetical protein